MLPREIEVAEGAAVFPRQNNRAPCPRGNGTTIGSVQQFTVLCNTSIDGDVLDTEDASDFTACADLCSSFHPKCDGATFDGSKCVLMANIRSDGRRFSRRTESALATFPGASSDCVTLAGAQQARGTSFTTMCGFVIDGSDLTQNFAPTFQDCLGQCAATTGCAAVSFDPSQDLGFKNCYLKNAVSNSSTVGADRRTDSAMVVAAAAIPLPATSDPPAASSPALPAPATSAGLPAASSSPAVTPGAGSGAIFFTPPGGTTAAAAPAPDPATATQPTTSNPFAPPATTTTTPPTTPPNPFQTSSSPFQQSSSTLLNFPFPTPSTTNPLSTSALPDAPSPDTTAPSSMAWVAAPVVGGVAAMALIAVSFVLLKRRRRGQSSSSSSSSAWWTGWMPRSGPLSPRLRGMGKRGRGMGNFSEVESGRRSVGGERVGTGVRGSVVGFVTGRPVGMERLSDIEEGRAELRRSLNGLGQNKW